MDGALVGSEYAAHLTDSDLKLLASLAGGSAAGPPGTVPPGPPGADTDAGWLRRDPGAIPALLSDPRVFEAVFGLAEEASRARPRPAAHVARLLGPPRAGGPGVALPDVRGRGAPDRDRAGVHGPRHGTHWAAAAGPAVR